MITKTTTQSLSLEMLELYQVGTKTTIATNCPKMANSLFQSFQASTSTALFGDKYFVTSIRIEEKEIEGQKALPSFCIELMKKR